MPEVHPRSRIRGSHHQPGTGQACFIEGLNDRREAVFAMRLTPSLVAEVNQTKMDAVGEETNQQGVPLSVLELYDTGEITSQEALYRISLDTDAKLPWQRNVRKFGLVRSNLTPEVATFNDIIHQTLIKVQSRNALCNQLHYHVVPLNTVTCKMLTSTFMPPGGQPQADANKPKPNTGSKRDPAPIPGFLDKPSTNRSPYDSSHGRLYPWQPVAAGRVLSIF